MNGVFIVPTGIGAELGGHAGDATPAAKMVASICDNLIIHPNVVNASDLNEMTNNMWYVEGSLLDRFLENEFVIEKPRKQNKILLVYNKWTNELANAVSAARCVLGSDIEPLILNTPLIMIASFEGKKATGIVTGYKELIEQIKNIKFDALAIASFIDVPETVALDYFKYGGVNPWGGVEAIASKLIAKELKKPVAHAPSLEEDGPLRTYNNVVDPRESAEILSEAFIHCVFKGLQYAPKISYRWNYERCISVNDIDFLITPDGCYGAPHEACYKKGIPIISVKENKTIYSSDKMDDRVISVNNYLEAVGYIAAMKAGVCVNSVRRPLKL